MQKEALNKEITVTDDWGGSLRESYDAGPALNQLKTTILIEALAVGLHEKFGSW
jgi:hypothetical protein